MVDVWQQATLFGWLPDAPQLLPPDALRGLWLPLITAQSSMLAAEREVAAAQASDAWQLAIRHGYAFPRGRVTTARDDNVSWFAELAQAAQAWLRARNLMTRAELPNLISRHAARLRPLFPARIQLTPTFASDPALEALWRALRGQGVVVATIAANDTISSGVAVTPIRVERARDGEHELDCALNWLEQRLAEPPPPDGDAVTLIVPNLAQSREAWQRRLRSRFNPCWWRDPTTDRNHFDLSLGRSLADQASVRALLTLLQATSQPLDVELLAQALTHPRWAWAPAEIGYVHGHLRELMDRGIARAPLAGWPLPPAAQALMQRIADEGRLRSTRRVHAATVEQFITAFTQRALIGRSELFQLEETWRTLLRDWSGHDAWFAPLAWPEAVSELSWLARDTVFQPESGAGRIHVIGLLESAGVPLTCARLVGMSDRVLPERLAPNPLLPRTWQAQARVGLGSRTEVAARSTRLVGNWQTLIPDLTVSYAAENEDGPTSLSPLFSTWPVVDSPSSVTVPATTLAPPPIVLESISDESLPVSASEIAVEEGTSNAAQRPLSPSRLREQAQCPRRAAAQRLGLEPWPTLSPGITPLLRGNLVHGMLAAYGDARRAAAAQGEPPDAAALTRVGLAALDHVIAQERATRPGIAAVIWQTEHARIAALLEQVLATDAAHPDMAVVAIEAETRATVAGQRFRGKVDRVDAGGGVRIILDYKTGSVSRSDWIPDKNDGRLADPQLPLYALMDGATADDAMDGSNRDPVRGVAWFVVSDDRVDCIGVGDDDSVVGARQAPELQTWDGAVALWQPAIAALVEEWQAGVADVAPLKGRATCQHCEYGAFCRERWSLAGAEEDADSADSGSADDQNDSQGARND